MTSYGDIRDVLEALPHHVPDDGGLYRRSDLFVVRHEIIRKFDPQPVSVFEFGALVGYFLVTALDAAPSIQRVGWCDNEHHTRGSNELCWMNLRSVSKSVKLGFAYPAHMVSGRYDLVSVDGGHTYGEALVDLHAADRIGARWILVDDWTAMTHTACVQAAVHTFREESPATWRVDEYETVNGLAVLTREEA